MKEKIKKIYPILISIGLLIPFFSFAQTFERDLYFGIQNDQDVTKLQEFLTDEGVYSGPITGNFFSLTLKAVKDYQSREGIAPVAGYFGPKTRVRANAILSSQIQASESQAISETGATTTPLVTPKTTTDVFDSLQSQINLLFQQIVLLQQQLQTQQQTQQNVQNIQSQVTQQTQIIQQQQQTIQQIQQNTQQIQQNAASSSTTTPIVSQDILVCRKVRYANFNGYRKDKFKFYHPELVNTDITNTSKDFYFECETYGINSYQDPDSWFVDKP